VGGDADAVSGTKPCIVERAPLRAAAAGEEEMRVHVDERSCPRERCR
jgi:hypothetical protein